jgi:hypothetical protein
MASIDEMLDRAAKEAPASATPVASGSLPPDEDWKLFAQPPSEQPSGDSWSSLHNFIWSPNGLLRSGAQQAWQGVHELFQPGQRAAGGADILEGAGRALAPVAIGAFPPALVAAPAATIGGIALGAGGALAGSAAGQALAEHGGAGPQGQRLASDIGAAAGGTIAGALGSKIGSWATRLNPERAVNRIFRPTPADTDFPEVTPEAFSDLKRYGGQINTSLTGKPKLGAGDLRVGSEPINTAIGNMQAGLDQWLDRARTAGVKIPGDQIVNATKQAIPDLLWTRDPQTAQSLVGEAQQAFGGKTFTPDQFRDWLKTENGTLRSFYNRAAPVQGAAEQAGTPSAIEEAQANAIRNELYQYLDPEHNGAGPREIQRRTGNLYKLRDAAERRYNSILGEKPVTPLSSLATPAIALTKLVRGYPSEALGSLLHPFQGPSDALITDLYRQLPEGADLPLPSTPVNPPGTRQLGPATSPIGVSGVIVPDIAGAAQRDAAALNPPTAPYGGGRPPAGPLKLPPATGGPIITPELSGYARTAAKSGPIQLPPPSPGQPPLNLPQKPPANVVTGPGAGGSAITQSTGAPPAPLPAPGELGGSMGDVLRTRQSQATESSAKRMGKAIISQQPPTVPSSGTLKYDPATDTWIPETQ